jgi:hypothetical protein
MCSACGGGECQGLGERSVMSFQGLSDRAYADLPQTHMAVDAFKVCYVIMSVCQTSAIFPKRLRMDDGSRSRDQQQSQ